MESNTAISLGLSSNDREGVTGDKEIHLADLLEKGNSYICMEEISDAVVSNRTVTKAMKPITKLTGAMSANPIAASNINQVSDITPSYERIIYEDSAQNIYEDIIDKAKFDASNNTKITNLDNSLCTKKKKMTKVQPQIMTNKCRLALAVLFGLVITVPAVSLVILWNIKSRDEKNIKEEPAINLTTIGLTDCWDKSLNFSNYCNNSIVTELTVNKDNYTTNLTIREEMSTSSSQTYTSPVNQKTTGKSCIYYNTYYII